MEAKLIELAYEISDEIKSHESYKMLIETKHKIETDPLVIELIETFNKVKIKYEEVQKYGKYHPDLKKVQIEMKEAKESLYSHSLIAKYKKLEKELQKLLDDVSSGIAEAISKQVKHPNEVGLIPKH